jgi:predicted AlkP superfamily pyrophosphatase or phosphodiesterase
MSALSRVLLALVVTAAACAPRAAPPGVPPADREPGGPIRHVFVVTVDGLMPEAYLRPDARGLAVPNLRAMARTGAVSPGARSVFPTVTYPAHTSIATGVSPLRHGIHSNRADDPLETNLDGWRWYAEDIQTAPIWQLAVRAGYRTALIGWPVTVGATATLIVPEFWRAKHPDDYKLLRALSTPGLLDEVARAEPSFRAKFTPGDFHRDEFLGDIASFSITKAKPHLLMLHLVGVDAAQHKYGLWTTRARAAIENADRQLGRLVVAAKAAGIWESTAIVLASDHGFAEVTTMVRPGVLLTRAGLVVRNAENQVTTAKAFLQLSGGLGYAYLRDPNDAASAAALRAVFAAEQTRPGGGIGRIFEPSEIRAAGGDPRAVFAFEAAPGASFGPGYLGDYEAAPIYPATHGFSPDHPKMLAALVIFGPAVSPAPLADARLIDIAPTVAAWLDLPLPRPDGRPLAVLRAR